jgi:metalloendopeptidase OMA1, mitochondrial
MKYPAGQAVNPARNFTRPSLIVLIAATLALIACATVPHTGRRQFNMVSDEQLQSISNKAYKEILAKAPESRDTRMKNLVDRVVDRVGKAAEGIDKPSYKWEVRLIDKDEPNAFCLPGGKIVVYTGIIPYARNEAGLAAVIAHEVAHAVARHGAERLSQQLALKGVLSAGGQILTKEDGTLDQKTRLLLGALGMGGTFGVILPYSRTHEFEADRIGELYMAKAGYDPKESIKLWDRMSKANKVKLPVWMSTHPADQDRLEELQKHLPEAEKLYAQAPEKFGTGVPL